MMLSEKWHSHFSELSCTRFCPRCRRRKLRITRICVDPDACSLRCSSSPRKARRWPCFSGGPKLSVKISREVSFPTHMSPEMTPIKFYSAACGRRNSLQEGFFDRGISLQAQTLRGFSTRGGPGGPAVPPLQRDRRDLSHSQFLTSISTLHASVSSPPSARTISTVPVAIFSRNARSCSTKSMVG